MTSDPQLLIVAATRLQEDAFWRESLLGRSLAQQAHSGYGHCISYANRSPLALPYNRGLDQAPEGSLVVFCHDDVWLGDEPLGPKLGEALRHFDLVGVAGNSRRDAGVQAWWLKADGSGWDWPNLVGALRHGSPGEAQLQTYGPSPAPASLLDGVFLAGRACLLRDAGLRFDPSFPFHHYDLDLCRSAEQTGLRLGVWPLNLIHASGGAAFTPSWKACLLLYRQKWEPPTLEPSGADARRWQYAIARAHQLLEQWSQALAAYDAVLALEPTNAIALAHRARLLLLMEDSAGAESALRSALAQQPSDVDLLFRLAALMGHQQRPAEAIELWRQLLRQDRLHIGALLNLGGLLMETRQFALARSAFMRVLKQEPNHSQALIGLGQCQEATGDAEAALATYIHGLALDPADLNLLTMAESMRLGLCLWDNYDARTQQLAQRLEQGLEAGDPVPMAVPMRVLSFPLPLELPRRVASCHASTIAAAMAPLGQVHLPPSS